MNNHSNHYRWAVWLALPVGDVPGRIVPWRIDGERDGQSAESFAHANCPLGGVWPPVFCRTDKEKDSAVSRLQRKHRLPVQ